MLAATQRLNLEAQLLLICNVLRYPPLKTQLGAQSCTRANRGNGSNREHDSLPSRVFHALNLFMSITRAGPSLFFVHLRIEWSMWGEVEVPISKSSCHSFGGWNLSPIGFKMLRLPCRGSPSLLAANRIPPIPPLTGRGSRFNGLPIDEFPHPSNPHGPLAMIAHASLMALQVRLLSLNACVLPSGPPDDWLAGRA